MTRMSLRPGGVEVENALGGEINVIFGTVPRGALASNVKVLPIAGKRFGALKWRTPSAVKLMSFLALCPELH